MLWACSRTFRPPVARIPSSSSRRNGSPPTSASARPRCPPTCAGRSSTAARPRCGTHWTVRRSWGSASSCRPPKATPPTSRSSRWTRPRAPSRSLGIILFGASLLATGTGAALGWWASRRALLPLSEVGSAAEAIAGGRLDTRLEAANDPDLARLTESFNDMAAGPGGPDRPGRAVRLRRQPRAALAAHDPVGLHRGAEGAQGRPRRAGRERPGPPGGRRGPLRAAGQRPAGDLPSRSRCGGAGPGPGRPVRAGAARRRGLLERAGARALRRGRGRYPDPGRQAAHGAGRGQPARQRSQVRGRGHRGPGRA